MIYIQDGLREATVEELRQRVHGRPVWFDLEVGSDPKDVEGPCGVLLRTGGWAWLEDRDPEVRLVIWHEDPTVTGPCPLGERRECSVADGNCMCRDPFAMFGSEARFMIPDASTPGVDVRIYVGGRCVGDLAVASSG